MFERRLYLGKAIDMSGGIAFVNFESSGTYSYSGIAAGTNLVEDLNDKSLNKGMKLFNQEYVLILLER